MKKSQANNKSKIKNTVDCSDSDSDSDGEGRVTSIDGLIAAVLKHAKSNDSEDLKNKSKIQRHSLRKKRQSKTKATSKAMAAFEHMHPDSQGPIMFYKTHDNGGRPFRVILFNKGKSLVVQRIKQTVFDDINANVNDSSYEDKALFTFHSERKIFVGNSPKTSMTTFGGGHGKYFEGNSFLVDISKKRTADKSNQYVFIGERIFCFHSLARIVRFVSPVGNNDVPYPYAMDSEKNCYLMSEEVVMLHNLQREKDIKRFGDPSLYYTDNIDIITFPNESQIIYDPKAVLSFSRSHLYDPPKVIKKWGLNKMEYIKLMKRFGQEHGMIPLKIEIMYNRIELSR